MCVGFRCVCASCPRHIRHRSETCHTHECVILHNLCVWDLDVWMPRVPQTIRDNSWQFVTIRDNSWQFVTIRDNSWQFVTIRDNSCHFNDFCVPVGKDTFVLWGMTRLCHTVVGFWCVDDSCPRHTRQWSKTCHTHECVIPHTLCAWDLDLCVCDSCVTCRIHVCDMSHSHVWHVAFTCVTCRIHMCDMSHSHVWHVAFTCVTCRIHMCDMSHCTSKCKKKITCAPWLSFTCATWWIHHVCDSIHSHVTCHRIKHVLIKTHSSMWLIPL